MAYRINVGGFEDFESPAYQAFAQAHQHLVEKYNSYNRDLLKKKWLEEYGGTVITKSTNGYIMWTAIEFESEADYFWFRLKAA